MTSIKIIAATAILLSGFARQASADMISWSGSITQSPFDASQLAVNNPSLNNIFDFQSFLVTFSFTGTIAAPGTYNGFIGSALLFSVASAPATEVAFSNIYLTITPNGAFDDFSLLGCLTTGGGCFQGNQLDGNFEIPAAGLHGQNVTATGLDQPHPLDLLEDDGSTEVQGIISGYSYNGTVGTSTPEPASFGLVGLILGGIALRTVEIKIKEKQ